MQAWCILQKKYESYTILSLHFFTSRVLHADVIQKLTFSPERERLIVNSVTLVVIVKDRSLSFFGGIGKFCKTSDILISN